MLKSDKQCRLYGKKQKRIWRMRRRKMMDLPLYQLETMLPHPWSVFLTLERT